MPNQTFPVLEMKTSVVALGKMKTCVDVVTATSYVHVTMTWAVCLVTYVEEKWMQMENGP